MADARWKIGDSTIDFSQRALIMGVLNVTPDSFSDGSAFFESNRAHEQALRMIYEGAEIIDIGGESTRPGANAVAEDEERRRVVPVIKRVREANGSILISFDTSEVAEAPAA